MNQELLEFYHGKKILVTGHTGFKGTWMCHVLNMAGANVIGYSLAPPTEPSLFTLSGIGGQMKSYLADVRDLKTLSEVIKKEEPEIIIHMAAQPIVRESYRNPVYTYEVNVMGTVNLLESIRMTKSVKSFLNVTTDKVYQNREWEWGYREDEPLNGYDPYSNSKSCSELVTDSYKNSFLREQGVAISTARAGNVIGGGDFAADRIIPDCMRAIQEGKEICIRNPYSTRPYQHVLEPVMAYLMIAKEQYEDASVSGNYNVGPNDTDCLETGEIVTRLCAKWNERNQAKASFYVQGDGGPHEANYLKLDCSRIRTKFNWKPKWTLDETLDRIVEWYVIYQKGDDIVSCIETQIKQYLEDK